jgi:3-deoxy-D-manno-octulosonate 8-phosphate phosphatase (KDO 8-P phosphatase)
MVDPTAELMEKARAVRLLLADVDGVLTDGGLHYFGETGVALRFHVRDGFGLTLAMRSGIDVGLISGREEPVVRRRAAELGIEELHLGAKDKAQVVDGILERRGLEPRQAAYIGDDLIDLSAMERVGLPVAVADAAEPVRLAAAYVTHQPGGHGAIRELVDLLLSAR